MNAPQAAILPDGRRLHLHHGPIDLIVEAIGAPQEINLAYAQAQSRFATILQELVDELPMLRQPSSPAARSPAGKVTRHMAAATAKHHPAFVTPMAAVAGAVADEILSALCEGRTLDRAYVNNGGDIALYLAPGQHLKAAIANAPGLPNHTTIRHSDPSRGIATSGWRGRSLSLGIADAVTVTAKTAATADVAATLIANRVDLPGHPAIRRAPASSLSHDSDLGDRAVTTVVGTLNTSEICTAIQAGAAAARAMAAKGLIHDAAIFLAGQSYAVTPLSQPHKEICYA